MTHFLRGEGGFKAISPRNDFSSKPITGRKISGEYRLRLPLEYRRNIREVGEQATAILEGAFFRGPREYRVGTAKDFTDDLIFRLATAIHQKIAEMERESSEELASVDQPLFRLLIVIDTLIKGIERKSYDCPRPTHFRPEQYYAGYALYWIDQAAYLAQKGADEDCKKALRVAKALLGRAEMLKYAGHIDVPTLSTLIAAKQSARHSDASRRASIAARSSSKKSEVVRQLIRNLYQANKRYQRGSVHSAAQLLLPHIQAEVESQRIYRSATKPHPSLTVVQEEIKAIRAEK